jgi:hypothetical protein
LEANLSIEEQQIMRNKIVERAHGNAKTEQERKYGM